MAALLQRAQKLELPACDHEQHAVFRRELVHVAQLVGELAAQRPQALRDRAADGAAERCARTQREAMERQVGHHADGGTDGHALAEQDAGVLQRLGVEEVHGPAAFDHRQRRLVGIALAETVEREQVVRTSLRLVEHVFLQRGDQALAAAFDGEFDGRYAAAHRGRIDQQLGDARRRRPTPLGELGFEISGHAVELCAPVAQERGEVAVELALGADEGRGCIEAHHHVQAVGRAVLSRRPRESPHRARS